MGELTSGRVGELTGGRVGELTGRRADGLTDRVTAALTSVPTRVSLVCETDGTVAWASPTARPLLGLDPDALVGTRIGLDVSAGRPAFVLGGDGRPRRIEVRVVDLCDHAGVGGLLVEWEVLPVAAPAPPTGLPRLAEVRGAVARLAGDGERGIGVVRLRADRALPDDAVALLEERLRHALRASDQVGRLDDGDIVVVCPGHWTPSSAANAAQRLRSHVNGPVRTAQGIVAVRLDAGVATGTTGDLDELIRRAAAGLPAPGEVDRVDDAVGAAQSSIVSA